MLSAKGQPFYSGLNVSINESEICSCQNINRHDHHTVNDNPSHNDKDCLPVLLSFLSIWSQNCFCFQNKKVNGLSTVLCSSLINISLAMSFQNDYISKFLFTISESALEELQKKKRTVVGINKLICVMFLPLIREIGCLTHGSRVTHICVGDLTICGSDDGLSPARRRQAIIWTNAGGLLIGPLGTNFSEILIKIHTLLFKKMHLKMLSVKWQPFCLSLNVLMLTWPILFRWPGSSSLIYVDIGSGNGLLPDGTKPLPEPMLMYHQPDSDKSILCLCVISVRMLLVIIIECIWKLY